MRNTRFFLLVPVFLAAVSAASCGPKVVPERTSPRESYMTADPMVLLQYLRARNSAITSFQAAGELEYRFTYSERGFIGTTIRLQFQKPDRVYVRGLDQIAGTLFLMVSNGMQYWAEDTTNRKVFTGTIEEAVSQEGLEQIWEGLSPKVLAESLLLDDIADLQTVCETRVSRYIITLIEPGSDGTTVPRRRIYFERNNLRVFQHDIFTETGELATQVLFGDYRVVDGVEIPHWLKISRPWQELVLKLELTSARVNPEVVVELFEYEPPAGFEIQEMKRN